MSGKEGNGVERRDRREREGGIEGGGKERREERKVEKGRGRERERSFLLYPSLTGSSWILQVLLC